MSDDFSHFVDVCTAAKYGVTEIEAEVARLSNVRIASFLCAKYNCTEEELELRLQRLARDDEEG